MAVKIRLARRGRKKKAMYDVIVADAKSPRDGRLIEKLGIYNPLTNPATIDISEDKTLDWLLKGAQPTDTARRILSHKGIMLKKHLQVGVLKGAITQEEADKKFDEWVKGKESAISNKIISINQQKAADAKARLEAEKKVNEAKAEALRQKLAAEVPAAEAETEETEAAVEASAEEAPAAEVEVASEALAEEKAEAPAETAAAPDAKKEAPAEEAPKAEATKEDAPTEEDKAPKAEKVKEEAPAEEAKEEAAPKAESKEEPAEKPAPAKEEKTEEPKAESKEEVKDEAPAEEDKKEEKK